MSQLVCPLCGRFVGIRHFDPSNFDDDIFAVDVRGLGRGRGFEVVDSYSVLKDTRITGLIKDRCHRILSLIEGKGHLPPGEADALRATLEQWMKEAGRLEQEARYWEFEAKKLQKQLDDLSNELEKDEDEDEWEAEEEMDELLELINKSANSDFDRLRDAIGFLLEG